MHTHACVHTGACAFRKVKVSLVLTFFCMAPHDQHLACLDIDQLRLQETNAHPQSGPPGEVNQYLLPGCIQLLLEHQMDRSHHPNVRLSLAVTGGRIGDCSRRRLIQKCPGHAYLCKMHQLLLTRPCSLSWQPRFISRILLEGRQIQLTYNAVLSILRV